MSERSPAPASDESPKSASQDSQKSAGPERARRSSRRRRWLRRSGVALVIVLVLYTLGGFFGVPYVVTSIVPPRVSERLNGELTIDAATFNPFTLATTVSGLRVSDEAGREIVRFERFEGDFHAFGSLTSRGWRFRHARLLGPHVEAELDENRALNLAGLLAEQQTAAGESIRTIPRVVVRDLAVLGASARFVDKGVQPAVERSIADLDFTVDTLDTEPTYGNPHALTAKLGDAASVSWQGSTFIDPLTADGTVVINGFDLAPFAPYAGAVTTAQLVEGRLSVKLAYSIAPVRTGQRLRVEVVRGAVEGLRLTSPAGEPLVEARTIGLADAVADVDASAVRVGRVGVDGLVAHVRRDAEGRLQPLDLLVMPSARAGGGANRDANGGAEIDARKDGSDAANRVDLATIESPVEQLLTALRYLAEDAAAAGGTRITIERVEATNGRLIVEDLAAPEPVRVALNDLTLTAGPVSSEDGFRTPLEMSFVQEGGGQVRVAGAAALLESRGEFEVNIDGLALDATRSYLPTDMPEPLVGVRFERASLDVDGTIRGGLSGDVLDANWEGEVVVREFAAGDDDGAEPIALGELTLAGVLVAEAALDARRAEATWRGDVRLGELRGDVTFNGRPQSVRVERFDTAGELTAGLRDGVPSIAYAGGLAAQGVRASGGAAPGSASLELDDAEVDLMRFAWSDAERSFEAERVALSGPRVEALLAMVEAASADDADATDDAASSGAGGGLRGVTLPLAVRVGEFVVNDGAFSLEDNRTGTPTTLAGGGLRVEAREIDSAGERPFSVELASGLGDVGSVDVRGEVNPFAASPFVDVVVGLEQLPLRPLSPLAEPNLGYTIDSGRLSLSLPVRLQDGQLDGDLSARLSSFYLGEKAPSETAPDLPLKLGLDILRDGDDTIRADVGISGDVNSPDFSIGGIIWNAAFDLVGNVATAPFRLLAGVFGGDDDVDLSEVAFEPGTDTLAAGGAERLDVLGKALRERPGLALVVVGLTGPADEAALREAALDEELAERARAGVGASEAEALLAAFVERFPERAPIRLPVPPGRRDQPAPSEAEMRTALLGEMAVSEADLTALAARRAGAVRVVLVEQNGVEASRVRVPAPDAAAAQDLKPGPRAAFELLSAE